ncbi:hypothetical protein CDD83_10830 [Cordyceps sp. RAO-2017]|nr:hypothetical protein CDD83_10830 [Cordyceps sp. RAO-2017]
MDPSAEEKVAYFELLRSLGGASPHDDGHGDNDELDALELRDRQLRFRFFRPPPPFPPAPADGRHVGRPAPEEQRGAAPGPVIANTQPGPAARPLPSAGPADDSFADETVVPDSARPAPRSRRGRGHSTPAPAARRRLAAADAREQSPSLHPGARKRKRGGAAAGAPRLRPAEEQVFSGLAFFYVPNNDIAPARRLRIGKAREYGAAWTRSYAGATHIVVDKNLDYADVAKVVPVAALARGGPKLVNEDYPIDCIQFRSLLDHGQKKYRVAGQPAVAGDDAVSGPPQAPESPDDGKRRDPAPPPPGTPQRSDEPPSQASVVDATPLPAGPQPRSTGATARPRRESPGGAEDELSGFISMMQEFRHLPLDNDDDELAGSEPERAETREDEDDVAASESESESARDGGGRKKAQAKSRRKGGRFEDRFACHHAGEQAALAENANARTVEVLQSMADFYERVGDEWRTLGYRKAITTLKRQRVRIRSEEEAARLPHIGRRIAQKIEEIVTTDRLRRLEYAREEATDGALQLFLQVYGVGSRQARQWVAQGYRSLDELRKGGVRLTASQAIGVEHFDDLQQAIPRREVEALGAVLPPGRRELARH